MRISRLASLTLAALLLLAALAFADDGEETWTGEILDLGCYMKSGARGPDHAACAKSCLKDKDMPMGLLTTDGTLLVLAASHRDAEPYEQLKNLGGEKATVTGILRQRGGLSMITVHTARPAS